MKSEAFDGAPPKNMYEMRPSTTGIFDLPFLKWMPVDYFSRQAGVTSEYLERLISSAQLTYKVEDGSMYIDAECALATRLLLAAIAAKNKGY